MKTFVLGALFGAITLHATPTESDLRKACLKRDLLLVERLLQENAPANSNTLRAAFESGSVEIVERIAARCNNLYIPKKIFTEYCDPKHANVARWILEHGQGLEYADALKHVSPQQ